MKLIWLEWYLSENCANYFDTTKDKQEAVSDNSFNIEI